MELREHTREPGWELGGAVGVRSFSALSSEVALAEEAPTAGGARGHLVRAGQMLEYTPESEILPVLNVKSKTFSLL